MRVKLEALRGVITSETMYTKGQVFETSQKNADYLLGHGAARLVEVPLDVPTEEISAPVEPKGKSKKQKAAEQAEEPAADETAPTAEPAHQADDLGQSEAE